MLEGTKWKYLWSDKNREEAATYLRIFFLAASVIYVLHYFLVDRPLGLTDSKWAYYRFGMAALGMSMFALYSRASWRNKALFRLPALLTMICFAFFQAKTMQWYAGVPYIYAFAMVTVFAHMIRLNALKSTIFAALMLSSQWSILSSSNVPAAELVSAALVTLVLTLLGRASVFTEINHFITQQEKLETQKQLIELNIEFTNQVKAFLPREISTRLTNQINKRRLSVIQAVDEVLRPRKVQVACLFSDIRGFTRGSVDLNEYISKGALPNIKECLQILEAYEGIPRTVGDLIFSYFDDQDILKNLINSLNAAVELSAKTEELNLLLPKDKQIRRYALISCGEAVVGNIGNFDSSREITAIGTPVNMLSRIDELTKQDAFKEALGDDKIIITSAAANLLGNVQGLKMRKINLPSLNLVLRDFPDELVVYAVRTQVQQKNIEKVAA